MAFCVQCGAKLEEGAKFCTNCGARQPEPQTPPLEQETPRVDPVGAGGAAPQQPRNPAYNYDPTIYTPGPQTQKKKGGGKILFIVLAALVVLGAVLFLVLGRGGTAAPAADDAVLGLYVAQKAEMNGINIKISDMWDDGFTIELKNKGKAEIVVDGEKGSAKWTLDGSAFTVKGSGVDCSGTLSDGVMTLENVMDTGVKLVFTKDGAELPSSSASSASASAAPATAEPAPAETPAVASDPGSTDADILGVYHADKAMAFGTEVDISTMWEKGFSIELQEGGKCIAVVDGTRGEGSWSLDGENFMFSMSGMELTGTFSDGVICLKDIMGTGADLYFTRDGFMRPENTLSAPNDSAWEGDYYGWWTVVDAGGEYDDEDTYLYFAWDVCATIEDNGDGTGYIEIWDEDNDDVAWADVSFDGGVMTSVEGSFFNDGIESGEWVVDPANSMVSAFDKMLCIHGFYTKPSNSDDWIEYYIFIRPWGMKWDDVKNGDMSEMIYSDMMPIEYENWYLPKIEAGLDMPDSFEWDD